MYFFPLNTKIDFIGYRWITFCLTLIMIVGTFIGVIKDKLEYGIDFKGGYMLEVRLPQLNNQPRNIAALRTQLNQLDLGDVSIQELSGEHHDILIKIMRQRGEDHIQKQAIQKVKDTLSLDAVYRKIEVVGPKMGHEILKEGIYAVLMALGAMLLYIAFRFEWQFGLCAILALVHDCISIIGMYVLTGYEFNTTAIVAILITAGYSINDTVVIYDRIRENLRKYRQKPLSEILNLSVNETLTRTILTSATTLLALIVLYIFGGGVIQTYTLPIICGITVGTYSSIFLAAPLLLYMKLDQAFIPSKNSEETAAFKELS